MHSRREAHINPYFIDFAALPVPVLRLALASLERQGKAKVFEGSESGDDMTGVKFV